jgi:hypothetical protein
MAPPRRADRTQVEIHVQLGTRNERARNPFVCKQEYALPAILCAALIPCEATNQYPNTLNKFNRNLNIV